MAADLPENKHVAARTSLAATGRSEIRWLDVELRKRASGRGFCNTGAHLWGGSESLWLPL